MSRPAGGIPAGDCQCETCELLRTYRRVLPWGACETDDGSERCVVCGTRNSNTALLIWCSGPFSVCGFLHAHIWRDRMERKSGAARALTASPSAPSPPTGPLPPTTPEYPTSGGTA